MICEVALCIQQLREYKVCHSTCACVCTYVFATTHPHLNVASVYALAFTFTFNFSLKDSHTHTLSLSLTHTRTHVHTCTYARTRRTQRTNSTRFCERRTSFRKFLWLWMNEYRVIPHFGVPYQKTGTHFIFAIDRFVQQSSNISSLILM